MRDVERGGAVSKSQLESRRDKERKRPRIFAFFFASDDETSQFRFILKFSWSGRIAATALPLKGAFPFAAKCVKMFVEECGARRFQFHSDNELALI